jgi:hypothetical protein
MSVRPGWKRPGLAADGEHGALGAVVSHKPPTATESTAQSEGGLSVSQDARDVGDVVEKFTGDPPGAGGNLPPRSVIVGVGPRPMRWRFTEITIANLSQMTINILLMQLKAGQLAWF